MEDVLIIALIVGGGYMLSQSGQLDQILLGAGLPALPPPFGSGEKPDKPFQLPSLGGGGGGQQQVTGGGGGTATTAAGCGGTVYQATGKAVAAQKTGKSTVHYASGKPDDPTHQIEATVNFRNYEFTWIGTLTQVNHDDAISLKFGGTHMGTGWYDCGVSFNAGQGCLGKEESHPDTDLCVMNCASMGRVVGKRVGVKAVYFGNPSGGGQVELWGDPTGNGQWKQLCPRTNNIGGFAPASAQQECQVRIDGAPGVQTQCAVVAEITPTRGSGAAPTTSTNPGTATGQSPQSSGGEIRKLV